MILESAVLCLALNVYHESRSEPVHGQFAVAHVTMNRAGGDQSKVCETVVARKQFSWTNKLLAKKSNSHYVLKDAGVPKDQKAWALAKLIARHTIEHKPTDITKGATYYHTTKIKPRWAASMQYVRRIGHHVFYIA
jgi:N-acetylmuramoyl-L-alanine amidase